jgi:Transposase, Mutator family
MMAFDQPKLSPRELATTSFWKRTWPGSQVRRVEDITEALWGTRVSPSSVSDLNKKIYGTIEASRNRPIEGAHPHVYLEVFDVNASTVRAISKIAVGRALLSSSPLFGLRLSSSPGMSGRS